MYGFGQGVETLSDDDAAKAKMWEMIGLTVGFVTSMSITFVLSTDLRARESRCEKK